jgi:hypothetical protein
MGRWVTALSWYRFKSVLGRLEFPAHTEPRLLSSPRWAFAFAFSARPRGPCSRLSGSMLARVDTADSCFSARAHNGDVTANCPDQQVVLILVQDSQKLAAVAFPRTYAPIQVEIRSELSERNPGRENSHSRSTKLNGVQALPNFCLRSTRTPSLPACIELGYGFPWACVDGG